MGRVKLSALSEHWANAYTDWIDDATEQVSHIENARYWVKALADGLNWGCSEEDSYRALPPEALVEYLDAGWEQMWPIMEALRLRGYLEITQGYEVRASRPD